MNAAVPMISALRLQGTLHLNVEDNSEISDESVLKDDISFSKTGL